MGEAAARIDHMTLEEAARLDPDREPGELDAGRWVPVTRSTWKHGEIMLSIGILLRMYAKANPGWSVSGGDPGAKLQRDPDVLRGPDLGVVRAERRPTGRGVDGWLEGAPDVAVEIMGDSQSASEHARKALEYLAAGAKMVWVVDPEPRKVMVFTPPNQIRVLGSEEVLDGGDVLPGFSCKVAEMFE
jgi:Uma2 family endonuclease